ncbi:hypothetical protein CJJ17_09180 [Gordonia polyisoprenivorans]|nr:hypothetical protein CJJ17_09180 [Gordonia polyisoprenivorans]
MLLPYRHSPGEITVSTRPRTVQGEVRVDRKYFLVGDDGGVFPVSSGELPADAVARLLGRR